MVVIKVIKKRDGNTVMDLHEVFNLDGMPIYARNGITIKKSSNQTEHRVMHEKMSESKNELGKMTLF